VRISERESAARIRARLGRGEHDRVAFRAALLDVAPADRDTWIDLVLGLGEVLGDGPELPPGCVPYLPCPVDALLRLVEQAEVVPTDVFVDIGSGAGRATALVHLLTGARAIGIEIQPELARAARELATRLAMPRVSCVEGDAASLAGTMTIATVFFFYCPFSGERLARVLSDLERIARTRTIRVGCVDLPLPPCNWLVREPPLSGDLAVYRSTP
jgi:SAM-dependent methyltransferase